MDAKDIALMKKLGGGGSGGSGLPTGGAPYQQLVTDGDGNTRWEDRLAYEGSKPVVSFGNALFVKVSDEIPSWASVDSPIKYWNSMGSGYTDTATPEDYIDLSNGSFLIFDTAAFIATDNVEYNGLVFPEKGVYFASVPDNFYVTGIASAASDAPEITWDGSLEVIKKIDEKFLPDQPVFYTSNRYLVDAEGAYITLEQAKAVGLNFIIQIDSGIARPVSVVYGGDRASFYVAEALSGGGFSFATYYSGEPK